MIVVNASKENLDFQLFEGSKFVFNEICRPVDRCQGWSCVVGTCCDHGDHDQVPSGTSPL